MTSMVRQVYYRGTIIIQKSFNLAKLILINDNLLKHLLPSSMHKHHCELNLSLLKLSAKVSNMLSGLLYELLLQILKLFFT